MNFKDLADKLYPKLIKKEINGEIKYFREREVYPIISEEGNPNWFNFITGGKWSRLIITLVLILIAVGFLYEYSSNLSFCNEQLNNINMIKNLSGIKLVP